MKITAYRLHYYLREIISVTMLWLFGGLLFVYIKFNDIPNNIISIAYPLIPGMTKKWIYEFSAITCICIGLLMGIFHTLIYPKMIKTRNIVLTIFLRIMVFTALTTALILIAFQFSGMPSNAWKSTSLPEGSGLSVMISMILMEMLVGMVVTLRTNMGKNYFRNFIRNAYFTPSLEDRIFMFMDLKDSTLLVEKMGSTKFSSFIQDCFKDISAIALDLGGEIYQFVGDEAVLSWQITTNKCFNNALQMHFSLIERLEKKRPYYMNKHNIFPEFRSSIHSGIVSAALVGVYKKEMAYHGGVLNLCSRLQKVCRDHDAALVISESFYNHLVVDYPFSFLPITDIELKGISEKQLVYKVIIDSKSVDKSPVTP
ncbi:adenylate/guanylate cyclase domain-containing protein [Flavobacterium chungbukense]|nr:adenylate/guanylate cyclase domain-containing protein [Flavobacterium chungbukense]MCC4920625.1 adenylate/guanylate cyclase domain-containing protein [Flavobacterium chungbukense]